MKKLLLNFIAGTFFTFNFNPSIVLAEPGKYGIKTGDIEKNLEEKLEEYNAEFFIYKPKFKSEFEKKYNIFLKGEYTFYDYKIVENVFNLYGKTWFNHIKLKNIIILSEESNLYDKKLNSISGKFDKKSIFVGLADKLL